MIRAGMKARIRIALLMGCALALMLAPSRAAGLGLQSVGPTFDQPVFATSPPGDPRLFVVERDGHIQVLHDGTVSQFLDIHTLVDGTSGERGLLSMAFDPNYASNGLFYVFYTDSGAAGGSPGDIHIDEYHVSADPNAANPSSRRTVWTFSHGAIYHNGGQLQFGPDGLLYISAGDNTVAENAQSLNNPYGKILRIDPHGAGQGVHGVPATNPFVGTAATPEIWSLGLRNPFRFSFDELTGDLVIGDVGENTFEEVDFAPASAGAGRGINFGWPTCEGFNQRGSTTESCDAPGAMLPVFAYPHDDPGGDVANGCAIIGGYVYRGSQAPEISGRYLYADLCTAELRSMQLGQPLAAGDRAESAPGALDSARSFGEDSACNLYVMNADTVFRITGSAQSATPACQKPPPKQCNCRNGKKPKKGRKCKKRKHKKHGAEAKKKHKHKKCKKKKGKKKRGRR
jgi:glucose/arabinose dehydrogenase